MVEPRTVAEVGSHGYGPTEGRPRCAAKRRSGLCSGRTRRRYAAGYSFSPVLVLCRPLPAHEHPLGTLDWVVIGLYFAIVFGVAIVATIRERRQSATDGATDYFLAGRNVGWFVIGASLFASNIGPEHLAGLAGSGAATGVAPGQFEVLASLILLLLGWVFVPFYIRSGVFTMPEFLERRYRHGRHQRHGGRPPHGAPLPVPRPGLDGADRRLRRADFRH